MWRLAEAHLPRGGSCGSSAVRAFARWRGGGLVANAASAAAGRSVGQPRRRRAARRRRRAQRRPVGPGRRGSPRWRARLGKLPSEGLGRSVEAGRVGAEPSESSLAPAHAGNLPWPQPRPWPCARGREGPLAEWKRPGAAALERRRRTGGRSQGACSTCPAADRGCEHAATSRPSPRDEGLRRLLHESPLAALSVEKIVCQCA